MMTCSTASSSLGSTIASVRLPPASMSIGITRSCAAKSAGIAFRTSFDTRASAAAETRGICMFFWNAETKCSSSSRPRRRIASLRVPPSRCLSAIAALSPWGVSTPVLRKIAEAFSGTVCLLPTLGAESQALTGLSLGNRDRQQGGKPGTFWRLWRRLAQPLAGQVAEQKSKHHSDE